MTYSLEKALTEKCSRLNPTVASCEAIGEITLDQFLDIQSEKVFQNKRIPPLRDPEDYYKRVYSLTEKRLGKKAAVDAYRAAACGAMCTADHHGALYNAQAFQGDILFSFLLKKLGHKGKYTPIASGGQIELGNVCFARGISVYTSNEGKQCLPFFRAIDHNQMAFCAKAIDREMIGKFRENFITGQNDIPTEKALDEILSRIYEKDDVLTAKNYAEQTTVIGSLLTDNIFGKKGVNLDYLEVEEIVRPLLIEELGDRGSVFSKILSSGENIRKLTEKNSEKGIPLASMLFSTSDDKGRKVFLTMCEDGTLWGRARDNSEICYPGDIDSICNLLETKTIFPALFTIAVVLAFERGITWVGGMFQASYLAGWQRTFSEYLEDIGLNKEAGLIRTYDCSGYTCGPMFAMYGHDESAMAAGPVEMWIGETDFYRIEELLRRTSLWDAHRIGLQEMYPDLVEKKDRDPNWCETVTKELYKEFPENIINE